MSKTLVPLQLQWKKGGDNVYVAGTFNNWTPVALRKKNDGSFEVTLEVPPGEVEFKFIVDGEWRESEDYDTKLSSVNSLNNVQLVELLKSEQIGTQDKITDSEKDINVESYENVRVPANSETSIVDENGHESENMKSSKSDRKKEETLQVKTKESQRAKVESNTGEKSVEPGKNWKQRCCVS
ncbi:SNF1 protein kinase subunit beta-2 [Galdieria sulphuraria]|uniref:Protein kinase activator n=1 Tax=Galdieria sulphuraria TaxID=130081 RepID=M2VRQ8_GALSU|nr:protein kinase activator [Galdieria sulphuraria]EME25791.1 protein kinase activator [Galdieria sulphuraria]GJD10284.1 SNF1 protein kinase subunit beta-2 [Galdieria sulphuraria]|eukprot:XP_005702311.1 protein kinase activator [Galdieria sulphuraria]